MVMINIVKIESNNVTENCLLNNFSVRIFFYQLKLIYLILIWSRSRNYLYKIWTNILYNMLSIKWELKMPYQQNFPVEEIGISFFGQSV